MECALRVRGGSKVECEQINKRSTARSSNMRRLLVPSWVQHPYLPIRLPNPHTQDSLPRPSTSTHAPQSLNSAFSSTIVRGGQRRERSRMRRRWHCLRPRQARAEVHIDYPAAERLSLFSVCFTPSFTAHSSHAATTIAFDLAFLLLNTFTTRTCTFFSMAYVLPAKMPATCAPCPLSSTGASPS